MQQQWIKPRLNQRGSLLQLCFHLCHHCIRPLWGKRKSITILQTAVRSIPIYILKQVGHFKRLLTKNLKFLWTLKIRFHICQNRKMGKTRSVCYRGSELNKSSKFQNWIQCILNKKHSLTFTASEEWCFHTGSSTTTNILVIRCTCLEDHQTRKKSKAMESMLNKDI